jgi:hypothetical protein
MMVALLLYACCQGIYSSRRIAGACEERVDFMAVTGLQKPYSRTISHFHKRHLKALGALFGQVLELCRKAGLVRPRRGRSGTPLGTEARVDRAPRLAGVGRTQRRHLHLASRTGRPPTRAGQQRAGLGNSPRAILEEIGRIQSTDVVLPLADDPQRDLRIRCVVRPDRAQALLLDRLGLRLPERLRIPPRFSEM